MSALESANKIKAKFGDIIAEPTEFRGEISVRLADAERVVEVMSFAKTELSFDFLTDISNLDNYGEDPRWTLVYHLYGLGHHQHLRIKTEVSEEKSELPTVTSVWRTADWHEREIYDMMGIRFRGHADLRRILMWEGYPYFPLRKDFPLAGKSSDVPEVAFTQTTPMMGGPFVTIAGGKDALSREPRVRIPETDSLGLNARVEWRDDVKEAHGENFGPGPIESKK
jgi:NADH-quinone oxidoreductase subunit C